MVSYGAQHSLSAPNLRITIELLHVVDDENDYIMLLRQFLERLEDFFSNVVRFVFINLTVHHHDRVQH